MKLRYKILIIAVFFGVIFMWGRHSRTVSVGPTTPPILPKEDKEQIIVDTRHHTITRVTEKGTQVTYLPEKPTVIDLRKGGDVVVHSPQYGYQVRPYVGLVFSDDARGALGLDLFYFKRLNVGMGMALRFDGRDGRLYAALSYNVSGNMYAAVTLDHKKTPGAMLALRF